MKKLLLSGAAAVALAIASTPAMADTGDGVIDLDVGGYFKAYGVYANHDDDFGGVGIGANPP